MRMRSITPSKFSSAPIGSWMISGLARRRVLICSTQRKKLAPARSILLTKAMRGTRVLVHLPPHGLRLRLHAGDRAEQRHGGIEHAQGALHLDGEVDVPRGVEDVDAVLGEALVHPLPEAGGGGGGDGDAALLLLLHVVHHGRAVMNLTDLVRHAGVEKDALGRRRLPRVDVRGDTDVPIALDGRRACHDSGSFPLTSGNGRRPCWPPPCGACLRACARPRRGSRRRPSARAPGERPWTSRCGHGRPR